MSAYNKLREIRKLITQGGMCLCGRGESCDWCASSNLRRSICEIIDRKDIHPINKRAGYDL